MKRRFNILWGFISLYALVFLTMIYFAFDITSRIEHLTAYSGEIITKRAAAPDYAGNWDKNDTLLFVTGEYPPYVYTDEGKLKGISYDALVAILDEMGVNYRIEMMSWSRGLTLLDNGQAFATFPYAISEERLKHYIFSETFQIIPDKTDFFYAYGAEEVQQDIMSLEALSELKVGGIYGYYYLETLQSLNVELDLSISEKECLEKLKDGRIDVAIFDPLVAEFMIDTCFNTSKEQFRKLSLSMKPNQVGDHLMLSKDNAYAAEFLKQFNEFVDNE